MNLRSSEKDEEEGRQPRRAARAAPTPSARLEVRLGKGKEKGPYLEAVEAHSPQPRGRRSRVVGS